MGKNAKINEDKSLKLISTCAFSLHDRVLQFFHLSELFIALVISPRSSANVAIYTKIGKRRKSINQSIC